ncbi:MAG: hypothetical protein Q7K11_00780 [Candidatus Berkelbacteria bacterium]|nr:hypothetical protein [Candidatus Berkelbacteria bacterium]
MKTEKVIFSFIAILGGILITGVAFFLYQSTKVVPSSKTKTVSIAQPSPTPKSSIYLTIESPKNEDVVDTKTITVSGKTIPEATIVISSGDFDQVISPARNGDFTATLTIGDGQNKIDITAIAPNGEDIKTTRIITFSTESF